MKKREIDEYQRTRSQLEAFHREFEFLTKKSANSPLNAFKLKIVNQTIDDANRILGGEFTPIRGFQQFSDDEIPSNSDVSMVLSQYLEAMEVFRCRHIWHKLYGGWYWKIDGSESEEVPTTAPRRGMSLDAE